VRPAGLYQGRWKEAIREFKFNDRWSSSRPLKRAMTKMTWVKAWDMVCAVPAAPVSERQGKPHLAAELGRDVARRLGLPFQKGLLSRNRGSVRQSELDGKARRTSARSAYARGKSQANLAGKRILLVDDVMTTGASLKVHAELLQPYAERIDVYCLARALKG
jgi:predicted amidophosphoribosyltransferase